MSGASVHTVRGSVPVADLGPALAHEHVVMKDAEFGACYPELQAAPWPTDPVADVVRVLQGVRERGIRTIVDCTAFLHGRDVEFVQRVNARVDLHVVMSTGIYTSGYLPHFLEYRAPGERDLLTDMFVRDIEVGIGDSGVRAQMIKVSVHGAGVTDNIGRVLRAAGRASAETGAPITAHTHAATRNGLETQRVLVEAGADPTRIILGHAGDSADLDYLRALMDAGSVIASDRFGLYLDGTPGEDQRVEILATLMEQGYADRIVLGHDTALHHDWGPRMDEVRRRNPGWVPTHVSDVVLPKLRAAGVPEAQLDQVMTGNVARLLSGLGG